MEFKCQYCDKEFKRKSVLSRHEKTSKQCILLRSGEVKIKSFDCTFCSKILSSKRCLFNHQKICKKRDNKF